MFPNRGMLERRFCSRYAECPGWLDQERSAPWGACPPWGTDLLLLSRIGSGDGVNSPLSTAQGRQLGLAGSWQEDGGAEGMQQTLHYVY